MKKEVIYTENAPEPGPYSQAIKANGFVFVAGQTAEDPKTNQPVHGSVAEQTRLIMSNIESILRAAGTSMDNVVRVDVYLSSIAVKEEFSKVYQSYFEKDLPARNAVGVASIDDGLDVEVEVIAVV